MVQTECPTVDSWSHGKCPTAGGLWIDCPASPAAATLLCCWAASCTGFALCLRRLCIVQSGAGKVGCTPLRQIKELKQRSACPKRRHNHDGLTSKLTFIPMVSQYISNFSRYCLHHPIAVTCRGSIDSNWDWARWNPLLVSASTTVEQFESVNSDSDVLIKHFSELA